MFGRHDSGMECNFFHGQFARHKVLFCSLQCAYKVAVLGGSISPLFSMCLADCIGRFTGFDGNCAHKFESIAALSTGPVATKYEVWVRSGQEETG